MVLGRVGRKGFGGEGGLMFRGSWVGVFEWRK